MLEKKDSDDRIFNDTFQGSDPSWANACVGENGGQDIETYADGFKSAPKILLDEVLNKGHLTVLVDTLIFPIVFCIRHAVELQIKDSIKKLNLIRANREVESYKISASHDIGNIWAFFKEHADNTDRRYQDISSKIEPYISDIAEIDPTGQTFRYPHSNEDEKHLTKTPIINYRILKQKFSELEVLLDELNRLNNYLIEEYGQNTHTPELSRNDLKEIAKKLPDRTAWGDSLEFKCPKIDIRRKYGLSNKKFSSALNIIQKHYEFSQEIGIEIPLFHASANDFIIFFECLNEIHPEKDQAQQGLGMDYFNRSAIDIERIQQHAEIRSKCVTSCIETLRVEALADISAIYELGRHNYYSEAYLFLAERGVRSFTMYSRETGNSFRSEVNHHLSKTNAKTAIIEGLKKLGQQTILNALKSKFDFLASNSKYSF